MHSICWSWLIYSYFSLDIIGKVALGHDFKSGQTAEAQEIAASWHGVVTMAQTFGAFVAQLVLRAFPFITSLPIPALQTPGVVNVTCGKLSRRLLDRGVVEDDAGIMRVGDRRGFVFFRPLLCPCLLQVCSDPSSDFRRLYEERKDGGGGVGL